MRRFRVTWPLVLAMCSGAAMALGGVDGRWAGATEAGIAPPSGFEVMEEADSAASTQPAPLPCVDPEDPPHYFDNGPNGEVAESESSPWADGYDATGEDFAYPEEYFYKYGYDHYDYADSEGQYGDEAFEAADSSSDDTPAEPARDDHIGELGNPANYGHERDWENAAYEFGDGTTADVVEVATSAAQDAETWDNEAPYPYEYDYGMDAEYGYDLEPTGYPYDYYDGDYYDGDYYDGDYATEQEMAEDDLTDNPAVDEYEADYSYDEYDYSYDEYDYSYDEYGYSYDDYDASYETSEEFGDQAEASVDAAAEETAGEADNEVISEASDDYAYDIDDAYDADSSMYDYGCESAYDYGYEPEYEDEDVSEHDYGYEPYDDYGYDYGYEPYDDGCGYEPEYAEDASQPETADDVSHEYGDEYGYEYADKYGDEYRGEEDYGYGNSSEAGEDAYWEGYGYEYSYPEEKYGDLSDTAETALDTGTEGTDTTAELPAVDHEAEYDFDSRYEGEPGEYIDYSQWDEPFAYDDVEPYEGYREDRSTLEQSADEAHPEDGYCQWAEGEEAAAQMNEAWPPTESGLELFAERPSDLLIPPDHQVLRTLETLCEEPSGARRAVLNDYLEGLGFEAIDFASRFEDVTGIETLSLADDLPGAAALLACFRLVQQGELGMDESVDLLRRTLERPSLDWIEGVREITAGAYDDWNAMPTSVEDEPRSDESTSTEKPLTEVLASLAVESWGQLRGTIAGAAAISIGWDWEQWVDGLQERLARAQSTSSVGAF